jgi:hypothetical protein
MVQPIDYSLNVKSPFESAIQGVQIGAGLADMQLKRTQQQAEMQAAQREAERQQAVQRQMVALMNNPNPTARDFTNVAMMLPEKEAKSMRENWDTLNKAQQESTLGFSGQVMAAFQSGAPDVGVRLLKERAEAERNSGNEDKAKGYETWAGIAETNPALAQRAIGIMVAQVPGGDKVIESVTKLGTEARAEAEAPAKLSKAQSDAQKAAVDAKFAESNAVIELQKKNWDITKIQEDIKIAKINSQIAAANAATAREGNAIKRQENQLKLDELKQKRETAINEKAAEVESARGSMDNLLNTADRVLSMAVAGKDPKTGKPTSFTSTMRAATGPLDSRLPTLQRDVADFEALVETMKSQVFSAMVPTLKGLGALSNAEGAKIESSLQNLSLSQSPEQFVTNVQEAQRLILKGRANLSKRYGVPDSIPDTPAAQPGTGTGKSTDEMLRELGVVR